MTRKRYGRIAALVLTASMAAGLFADAGPGTVLAAGEAEETASPVTEAFSIERLTSNYTNVSAGYTAADYRGEAKVFRIGEITDEAGADMLTEDNYGYEGKVANVTHGDTLRMTVEAPETALYWIRFDYLSYDQSILPIEFSLKVDGDYPFYEARNLGFETSWVQDSAVSNDRYGNEIVSMPSKLIQW